MVQPFAQRPRNRKPSRHVPQTLLNVTKTILATFIGNPHFGEPYAVKLSQAYQELQELVATIAVELEVKDVVETVGR